MELLLSVMIVSVMLWVIIPIGLRARVDAAYGVVRQNCSQLASYASQWAHQAIAAQDDQMSTATLADYYGSLAGLSRAPESGPALGEWVAGPGPSNWRRKRGENDACRKQKIDGRFSQGKLAGVPENTVEDMIPAHHPILNPFTKAGIFEPENYPKPVSERGAGPVPGAVAFGGFRDTRQGWVYFAFVFQGTDNTGTTLDGPDTFLAGMGLHTMTGLQHGIFAARIR